MSLDLSSPNAKNRITLIQKGLATKFRGTPDQFQSFLYGFTNMARILTWTAEEATEFGALDFTDADSGEKVSLHIDPSKVTHEMITAAHQARVQALADAEAGASKLASCPDQQSEPEARASPRVSPPPWTPKYARNPRTC